MSRNRDFAPVGNTCPMIDEVISAINADLSEDGYHSKKELVDIMEKIRGANLELRNWGNELYRDKVDLERELSTAAKRCESLEDELKQSPFVNE